MQNARRVGVAQNRLAGGDRLLPLSAVQLHARALSEKEQPPVLEITLAAVVKAARQVLGGHVVKPKPNRGENKQAERPRRPLFEAQPLRYCEASLELLQARGYAIKELLHADVGKRMTEDLLLPEPFGKLDRAPPPADRRLGVLDRMEKRQVGVSPGELAPLLERLNGGDGLVSSLLRRLDLPGEPQQPRQPP